MDTSPREALRLRGHPPRWAEPASTSQWKEPPPHKRAARSVPKSRNTHFSEDLGQSVTSRPSTHWSALLWAQSEPSQPPRPTCGRKQQAQVVPKSTAANVALLHGSVLQTDSGCGVGVETRVRALRTGSALQTVPRGTHSGTPATLGVLHRLFQIFTSESLAGRKRRKRDEQ